MIGSLQKSIKFDALLFLLGYSWLIVVGCSILVSRFSGPCFEVVRYPASKKLWRQLQLWGGCRTHHGIKAAIQNPGPSVEVGLAIASWHQGKASHAAGDRIDMDPGVVYSVITLLVRNPTIIRNITKIRKNHRNREKMEKKKRKTSPPARNGHWCHPNLTHQGSTQRLEGNQRPPVKVAVLTSASPAASKSNSRRNGPDVSPAARAARLLAKLACTSSEQLKALQKNWLGGWCFWSGNGYFDQVQVGSAMIAGGVCATTSCRHRLNLVIESGGTRSPCLDPGWWFGMIWSGTLNKK